MISMQYRIIIKVYRLYMLLLIKISDRQTAITSLLNLLLTKIDITNSDLRNTNTKTTS